jgi:hypothetical protein
MASILQGMMANPAIVNEVVVKRRLGEYARHMTDWAAALAEEALNVSDQRHKEKDGYPSNKCKKVRIRPILKTVIKKETASGCESD